MRVHSVPAEHPASIIATEARTPVSAEPDKKANYSDKMAGLLLANATIALIRQQNTPWHAIAVRVIEANTEIRASFISALDKELKVIRATAMEISGVNGKTLTKQMRSAAQYASNIKAIARAWNAGASIRGFVQWVNAEGGKALTRETWRDAGWTLFYQYALTIGKAEGKGRPRDNLLVRFTKWLDSQRDNVPQFSDEEKALLKDMDLFKNVEAQKLPTLVAAE